MVNEHFYTERMLCVNRNVVLPGCLVEPSVEVRLGIGDENLLKDLCLQKAAMVFGVIQHRACPVDFSEDVNNMLVFCFTRLGCSLSINPSQTARFLVVQLDRFDFHPCTRKLDCSGLFWYSKNVVRAVFFADHYLFFQPPVVLGPQVAEQHR